MFPNLNAELARRQWSIKKLAAVSGIKYDTLKNKMAGTTEFKRSEMFSIKSNAFPDKSIDYLFKQHVKKAG